MSVEDITESMHDEEGVIWLSIYYNSNFYRVKCNENGKMEVYDYEGNRERDGYIVKLMQDETIKYLDKEIEPWIN